METPKDRANRLVYGQKKPTALYEALHTGGIATPNDEDLRQIAEELEHEFEDIESSVRFLRRQLDAIRNQTGYHIVTGGILEKDR